MLYVALVILFFTDRYTSLEIKSQFLKSAVYSGVFFGIPVVLYLNYINTSRKAQRIAGSIIPILVAIYLIANNPLAIIFNSAAWQTDTIKYTCTTNRVIEFQIQDMGAFGYNKRTVEVYHITPLFMLVNTPPQNYKNNPEWTKVNREVNELEIKYP